VERSPHLPSLNRHLSSKKLNYQLQRSSKLYFGHFPETVLLEGLLKARSSGDSSRPPYGYGMPTEKIREKIGENRCWEQVFWKIGIVQ
jgi:hypothetical protein